MTIISTRSVGADQASVRSEDRAYQQQESKRCYWYPDRRSDDAYRYCDTRNHQAQTEKAAKQPADEFDQKSKQPPDRIERPQEYRYVVIFGIVHCYQRRTRPVSMCTKSEDS